MVVLNGSEKQVAWAEKLRAGRMEKVSELLAEISWFSAEQSQQIMDKLASVDSAKFWIDNRDYVGSTGLIFWAARQLGIQPWGAQGSGTIQDYFKVDGVLQDVTAEIGGLLLSRGLTIEMSQKIWLIVDLESGKFTAVSGEKPEQTDTKSVFSLQRQLPDGWAVNNPKFLAIKYSKGRFTIYPVVTP